jgi:hypothetical protein
MNKKFYLQIVTAHKDGTFSRSDAVPLSPLNTALDEADKIQRAFDMDCDPARSYVLDEMMVPIYAGGQLQKPSFPVAD